MEIPQNLIEAASQPVTGQHTAEKLTDHFNLVHHQLLYLRAALAVATITRRAIILPPILCQLDKYWAPLFNGAHTRARSMQQRLRMCAWPGKHA